MPCRSCLLALAAVLAWRPALLAAAPAALALDERYEWPDGASLRATFRQPESVLVVGGDAKGAAAGVSLPWLQAGPLVGRGLLRLAADPLGYSAGSPVYEERTGLVLDESLLSSRRGAVLTPLPGLLGLFAREGMDGTGCGAFAAVPLARGGALEGLLLASRPPPREATEDWYLGRSPSPGGQVNHSCARLSIGGTGPAAFSASVGVSSPDRASPGAFASVRMRGRLPGAEAAFLASGVTPGYRSPDGYGTADQSLVSGCIRVGGEGGPDSVEAAWSLVTERPSEIPGLDIPFRLRVRLALSRAAVLLHGPPCSLVLQGEKETRRDADGTQAESARFTSLVDVRSGRVEARALFGFSPLDGARLSLDLAGRPARRVKVGCEARADGLGTAAPTASVEVAVAVSGRSERHALEVGLRDCPLGLAPDLGRCFRLSLTTSIRVE